MTKAESSHPKSRIQVGDRFGSLLVVDGPVKKGAALYWTCRCDCGNEDQYSARILRPSLSLRKQGYEGRTGCSECQLRLCRICNRFIPWRERRFVCESDECRDADYERRTGRKLPEDGAALAASRAIRRFHREQNAPYRARRRKVS